MRDIQLVLERWGVWARESAGVDYSPIAAGFKGLLPAVPSRKNSCCDNDGIIVDGCVAKLKRVRPDEYDLIIRHYVFDQPKRAIARAKKKDEKIIRISMQMAEGFVDGCLAMLEINLEMDPAVEKQMICEKSLTRSAKCRLVC